MIPAKPVACINAPSIRHYCLKDPFDPPTIYPELGFCTETNIENQIYPLVRQLFYDLKLDIENFGSKNWNPLRTIVSPGQTIVIKPNLVTHKHIFDPLALYSTISHGSVIRPIVDYVYKALGGEGRIIIADNPIESADFKAMMSLTGIQDMMDELTSRGFKGLQVMDLRPRVLKEATNGDFYYEHQHGDPLGYATIDLGHDSMFRELDSNSNIHYYTLADKTIDHIDPRFAGPSMTDRYHNSRRHCYIVSNTVLTADVIFDIAKLKSHCKSGVSMALKNMLGVVYEKHCMPHHRPGSPPHGDSFPVMPPDYYVAARKGYMNLKKYLFVHHIPGVKSLRNILQKNEILLGKHIEHGNWKGNDTIWRTILDLNRIVFYAAKNGKMQDIPQRNCFALIDGIISQQGEGPMAGNPVVTSVLYGGFNPVLVDALAIRTMGLDYRVFKSVSQAREIKKWRLVPDGQDDFTFSGVAVPGVNFELSKGWR